MPRPPRSVLALALLCGCAEGGLQDNPQSEVEIAADHHLFWFRTLPGFGPFPPTATSVLPCRSMFAMAADSTYQLTEISCGSGNASDNYALAETGELTLFVTGSGQFPTIALLGGYSRVVNQPDLFFTDRITLGTSPSIGLLYGTEQEIGSVDLEGAWHLVSLHVMFSGGLAIPHNVGRAAHGSITVAADPPPAMPPTPPGSLLAISGDGMESGSNPTQLPITFGGTIQNLLQGTPPTGDGTVNLTVDYDADSRVFRAAAGRDIVMAVDEDETDGSAGMLFLVRQFDATTLLDEDDVAGLFLIGGQTLFVNAANAGSDAFVGTLELFTQGGFVLEAEGHQGIDFSYQGTYAFLQDPANPGVRTGGTGEQWFAAISRNYNSITLVDAVVEDRANNTPELNILIGVRRQGS